LIILFGNSKLLKYVSCRKETMRRTFEDGVHTPRLLEAIMWMCEGCDPAGA